MRFTTIFGLLLGFIIILTILFLSGSKEYFINITALLITVGGTLCATIIYYSPKALHITLIVLKKLFFSKQLYSNQFTEIIVNLARKSRKIGFVSLLKTNEARQDAFLYNALTLLADGYSAGEIREVLATKSVSDSDNFMIAERVLRTAGSLAPIFGMLGTVTGLIIMLGRITNPETIPSAMGIALVSTFYGLILSGLILKPLSGKIRDKNGFEVSNHTIITEGIILIRKGENSQIIRERLSSYNVSSL
ncbi:MAG: hypothetical protein DRH57_01830 [Candidatus Cloacimonadota bacterium]|nr:MAG: hypothetical protein DRH57_01830 [Candidatus Cloacimonadota bacterium]